MPTPDLLEPRNQEATLERPLRPIVDEPQPTCSVSEGTVANTRFEVLMSHIETRTVSHGNPRSMCASCQSRNSLIHAVGQIMAGPQSPGFSTHLSRLARARWTACVFA